MRKIRMVNKLNRICLILSINALVLTTGTTLLFAQPVKPLRPPKGKASFMLPPPHRIVHVGKTKYYVHKGDFYIRKPSGFVMVPPPLGAVVVGIPIGAKAILFGGITYYFANEVYYHKVPEGYVIVERPIEVAVEKEISPVVPSQQIPGEKVTVKASVLNVRSGPGLKFPVIRQIRAGDKLITHGYAPEWLYVETVDGSYGWVMLKYTSIGSENASG